MDSDELSFILWGCLFRWCVAHRHHHRDSMYATNPITERLNSSPTDREVDGVDVSTKENAYGEYVVVEDDDREWELSIIDGAVQAGMLDDDSRVRTALKAAGFDLHGE